MRLVGLDAFQAHEAEQVEAGHREQHDPGGQEALAREEVPLQHLVEAGEILQAGRQDDEAHHDLDARHPAAAARHALQVRGEQRQQEERQRQAGGEA